MGNRDDTHSPERDRGGRFEVPTNSRTESFNVLTWKARPRFTPGVDPGSDQLRGCIYNTLTVTGFFHGVELCMSLAGALEFLEDVTSRFPPGEGRQHALLVTDGKLSLQIWLGSQCRLFTIKDRDLAKHAYELIYDLEEAFGVGDS